MLIIFPPKKYYCGDPFNNTIYDQNSRLNCNTKSRMTCIKIPVLLDQLSENDLIMGLYNFSVNAGEDLSDNPPPSLPPPPPPPARHSFIEQTRPLVAGNRPLSGHELYHPPTGKRW